MCLIRRRALIVPLPKFGWKSDLAAANIWSPKPKRTKWVGIIGCEPFINGVAALLALIKERCLENVRIFADDGRLLLAALPDATLARMFLLFPDPWPKKRHFKRRFVNEKNLDMCARVLQRGGEFRVATDHGGYCRWILEHVLDHGGFRWEARGPEDWRERPADWPSTRYEAKARAAGRQPIFLCFRRTAGSSAET